jgi:hypothetical protein
LLLCSVLFAVGLGVQPAARLWSPVQSPIAMSSPAAIPSAIEFDSLVASDPIAAIAAGLARFERDVRGYSCMLHKQERINGDLGNVERIRHAVREQPFAVSMEWLQGGGSAKAALYIRGENGGRMKVKTRFLIVTDTDPNGILARNSSRYSIEDAGIANGMRRTLRAWQAARDAGTMAVQYLGRAAIPELGGRECHCLARTCQPLEVDNFQMSDPIMRSAADSPKDAFAKVTIYLDTETWMQIGTRIDREDGSLTAAYWFQDVVINPLFAAEQFSPLILKK